VIVNFFNAVVVLGVALIAQSIAECSDAYESQTAPFFHSFKALPQSIQKNSYQN